MPTIQSSSLLSPEDISSDEKFRATREKLRAILGEVQNVRTPKEHIKVQDGTGYPYPEFPYMLDLMNEYFPYRSEEIDFELNSQAGVVVAKAVVKDLLTGMIRTGVDAHRITFKKGMQFKLEGVVDIGNDYKSASQEALRNAYSRFGVCADIYKRVLIKPMSKEQESKFYSLVTEFNTMVTKLPVDDPRRKGAEPWIDKWIAGFKTQTQSTADYYIEQFTEALIILKEKLNA